MNDVSLPAHQRTGLLMIAVAALLCGLQYGYTLAVVAGAESLVVAQFGLTSQQLGLVVSNLDLGAAVGALLAGPLSDRVGRKRVMVGTALLFLAAAILAAGAWSLPSLLIGRMLGGCAVGATLIMPLYVAELAPARVRGLFVSFVQIGIVSGILGAYAASWATLGLGTAAWRWMFGIGIVPALLFLIVCHWLSESPRWLAARGYRQESQEALKSMLGPKEIGAELAAIERALEVGEGSWRDVFQPGARRALGIGIALAILSVTGGINAVILYGPAILLRGASEELDKALLGAIALGGVNFVFSLVAMVTIDRFGRKPLLLCGLAGMGIAMCWLGGAFISAAADAQANLLWPILAFVAFYAMSLGPVSWVIIAEVFPTRARGVGMAICIVVMYLADFVVTLVFPPAMQAFERQVFFGFAGICAAGVILTLLVIPETKDKSLEEISQS
jgi:sugar porter (SP) family MFS transporter